MARVRYVGGPKDGEQVWLPDDGTPAPAEQVQDGQLVRYHYVLVQTDNGEWQYALRSVVQGS